MTRRHLPSAIQAVAVALVGGEAAGDPVPRQLDEPVEVEWEAAEHETRSHLIHVEQLIACGSEHSEGGAGGVHWYLDQVLANPIPVIVPCHRVIGANGDLTGYGGGLDRKRELLRLEGALPRTLSFAAAAVFRA